MKLAHLSLITGVILSLSSALAGDIVVSKEERESIMQSARVWSNPGQISSKNMIQGPGSKFQIFQDVTCKFYDGLYTKLDGTGATPKFWCAEAGKDPVKNNIKIKYGSDNGEVYAEVVASRLLWALGFFADKAYPISVNCENCPEDPWAYLNRVAAFKRVENSHSESRERLADYILRAQSRRESLNAESMRSTGRPYTKRFDMALSEGKYDGKAIAAEGDSKGGFSLQELGKIDASKGGSNKAEVDALKLLLAFIKHGDSKFDNHRLTCPDENIIKKADGSQSCSQAHLVLQDLGATFGNGSVKLIVMRFIMASSKLDYKAWRDTPVWDDVSVCRARLKDSPRGTMANPQVSEAGRQMLSNLLDQLTSQQITEMFWAARADKTEGADRASIADWVTLFKNKRAEISSARCPN